MSDGLPTERQLAALEQRVLTRIRRRAAVRARIASGLATAALVAGAIVLVHPFQGPISGASSGSGGGASTADRSSASSAAVVRCHASSDPHSAARTVTTPERPSTASVAAACAAEGAASGSPYTTDRPPLVVCRGADGAWQVFPSDAHRSTLCTRNGLRAG